MNVLKLDETTIEYVQLQKKETNKEIHVNWKKSNQLIWLDIYKSEKSVRGKTSVGIILFSIKFSFPFVQISAYYVNGIVMRVCVSVSVCENCELYWTCAESVYLVSFGSFKSTKQKTKLFLDFIWKKSCEMRNNWATEKETKHICWYEIGHLLCVYRC